MILTPKKLEERDTIGIVGPASPMRKERLKKGIQYLKQQGYEVREGEHLNDKYGYLAGSDEDRAYDLNQMFLDPEVDAIFCTRGGYGTPRLLDLIDYDVIRKNPKIFVGYSDITALQLAIFKRTQVVTFSGPMVAVEMGKGIEPFTETHFWNLLMKAEAKTRLEGHNGSLKILNKGKSEGRLIGGCLSLICSLLGTPFLPDFKNAILFVEEIGEEPYRIDRNLTQLKLAGVLNQIKGIVFGQFHDCLAQSNEPSLTIERIIYDVTSDLDIPILAELPYGHVDRKYTIPIGTRVYLDAEKGYLEILEEAVA
ncbi:MAG: LD-carboxypeptidase [bacterium]